MTGDVGRYVTDAVYPAWRSLTDAGHDVPPHAAGHAIRAALPGILAAHRADVLREVFSGDYMESALVRRGIRDEAWALDDEVAG